MSIGIVSVEDRVEYEAWLETVAQYGSYEEGYIMRVTSEATEHAADCGCDDCIAIMDRVFDAEVGDQPGWDEGRAAGETVMFRDIDDADQAFYHEVLDWSRERLLAATYQEVDDAFGAMVAEDEGRAAGEEVDYGLTCECGKAVEPEAATAYPCPYCRACLDEILNHGF